MKVCALKDTRTGEVCTISPRSDLYWISDEEWKRRKDEFVPPHIERVWLTVMEDGSQKEIR